MITRLAGTLLDCDLTEVVLDVHGVGYALTVPMSTYDRLPAPNEKVVLHTHLQVREDAMDLYGFATREERQLFRILTTVSGIGPKLALNVLSCMSIDQFSNAILTGNAKELSKVSGIGKRVAERLIVELRERIEGLDWRPTAGAASASSTALGAEAQDAVAGLQTLGFKADKARKTVQQLCTDSPELAESAEDLIRGALKILNS